MPIATTSQRRAVEIDRTIPKESVGSSRMLQWSASIRSWIGTKNIFWRRVGWPPIKRRRHRNQRVLAVQSPFSVGGSRQTLQRCRGPAERADSVEKLRHLKIASRFWNSVPSGRLLANCVCETALSWEAILANFVHSTKHRLFQHNRPKTVIGHVPDRCNEASPNWSFASVVLARSLSSRTL